jgi:flavin reductase (DIM6/NTAB) family NADH-FMN oxidoreductase RutF/rubredoxin
MNTRAMQQICYGLYVISSRKGDRFNGQIANTVFQITSEPPTVAVSINKQNLTHEFMEDSKVFAVSVLSKETPMPFIGRFGFKSGRDFDKFADINFKVGATGAPVALDNATSYMECEVIGMSDVGTHTIFIGKVVDCEVLSNAEPMTYAFYHQIKGGKSPKTAPTYVAPEKTPAEEERVGALEGSSTPSSYRCTICEYVYDPAVGDPDNAVKEGTAWEDVPDAWVCPICGAPKSEFEKKD